LWVAVIGGIVALLCLGGAGVVALLYNNSTKIERSAPDAVVDNFLRAYLVDRDDKEASLYECKAGGNFAALSTLRAEMVTREKSFDVKVSVTWGALAVSDVDATHRDVAASLTISGASNGNVVSRRTEQWTIGVVDESGWRTCAAVKVS
jgi:hypothetical protein